VKLQVRSDKNRCNAQWRGDKDKRAKERLRGLVDSIELLLVFFLLCAIFFFPGFPSFGRGWRKPRRYTVGVLKFWEGLVGPDAVINQRGIKYRNSKYDRELTYHWI
jgi:hypothetical protein